MLSNNDVFRFYIHLHRYGRMEIEVNCRNGNELEQ